MVSVLIVDDEKLIRDTLIHYVQWPALGVDTVFEAENGKQALEKIVDTPPDIIVADIKMPHMNGMQLAQVVRERYPDIRFVFLSGHADKEHLKEAIHMHIDAYIEKPLNLDEIMGLIRKMAEECRNKKRQSNFYFFKGEAAQTTLNNRTYTLSQTSLQKIEKGLKWNNKDVAVKIIKEFCSEIRACEGTAPEYIRQIYFQLALQLQSAAEACYAKTTINESGRFSHEALKASRLDFLESEAVRITELLFLEKAAQDLNPVSLVNHFIWKNYADSTLTIDKIAQALNFNTSYLCTIYKQHTSLTINSVVTSVRIEEACKLLRSSDMRLYEIASQVGYSNGKYFAKVFTKITGISPHDYRRLHHE